MKAYAANNPDAQIRQRSSAGGIFSLLAEQVISEGGVVYGAAFDTEWRVAHKRVDRLEELDTLRRSKYVFSRLDSSIKDALADLDAGRRVLFCSVPCQVAAMRKIVGNHPRLLLVEVVCHGAPQPDYWEKYLNEICAKHKRCIGDIADINFRDKRTGWKNYSFTLRFNDGKEFTQPHDDNLYMRAFLADLTLRKPCFDCRFKYPDGSQADITLGDLWGIVQIAPEIDNDLGTTLIVARTDRGLAALQATALAPASLREVDFATAARFNPALVSPARRPAAFAAFETALAASSARTPFLAVARRFASLPLSIRLKRLAHKLTRI